MDTWYGWEVLGFSVGSSAYEVGWMYNISFWIFVFLL